MTIEALSILKKTIWARQERWTFELKLEKVATWTKKISFFGSTAVSANSLFLFSFTYMRMRTISAMMYNLYWSSRLMKLTLILLKIRKNISKATFIPMSAYKKLFLNKPDLSYLFSTKKDVITIKKVLSLLLPIF